jgi:hypothetical protein
MRSWRATQLRAHADRTPAGTAPTGSTGPIESDSVRRCFPVVPGSSEEGAATRSPEDACSLLIGPYGATLTVVSLIPATLGEGWRSLAQELADELEMLEPPAQLDRVAFDWCGLLRFSVRAPRESRATAKKIARGYEERASSMCEQCGEVGSVRAGVLLQIACNDCFTH